MGQKVKDVMTFNRFFAIAALVLATACGGQVPDQHPTPKPVDEYFQIMKMEQFLNVSGTVKMTIFRPSQYDSVVKIRIELSQYVGGDHARSGTPVAMLDAQTFTTWVWDTTSINYGTYDVHLFGLDVSGNLVVEDHSFGTTVDNTHCAADEMPSHWPEDNGLCVKRALLTPILTLTYDAGNLTFAWDETCAFNSVQIEMSTTSADAGYELFGYAGAHGGTMPWSAPGTVWFRIRFGMNTSAGINWSDWSAPAQVTL